MSSNSLLKSRNESNDELCVRREDIEKETQDEIILEDEEDEIIEVKEEESYQDVLKRLKLLYPDSTDYTFKLPPHKLRVYKENDEWFCDVLLSRKKPSLKHKLPFCKNIEEAEHEANIIFSRVWADDFKRETGMIEKELAREEEN